jgi:chromosome segregation ATPase
MISHEEKKLRAQAEQVRGRLQGLDAELRAVDDELESLATQRTHHELLDQACASLEKLGELGAASLFWGEQTESARVTERLREVRSRVSAFQTELGKLDQRRQEVLDKVGRENENLEILGEDLYQVRHAEVRTTSASTGPWPHRCSSACSSVLCSR